MMSFLDTFDDFPSLSSLDAYSSFGGRDASGSHLPLGGASTPQRHSNSNDHQLFSPEPTLQDDTHSRLPHQASSFNVSVTPPRHRPDSSSTSTGGGNNLGSLQIPQSSSTLNMNDDLMWNDNNNSLDYFGNATSAIGSTKHGNQLNNHSSSPFGMDNFSFNNAFDDNSHIIPSIPNSSELRTRRLPPVNLHGNNQPLSRLQQQHMQIQTSSPRHRQQSQTYGDTPPSGMPSFAAPDAFDPRALAVPNGAAATYHLQHAAQQQQQQQQQVGQSFSQTSPVDAAPTTAVPPPSLPLTPASPPSSATSALFMPQHLLQLQQQMQSKPPLPQSNQQQQQQQPPPNTHLAAYLAALRNGGAAPLPHPTLLHYLQQHQQQQQQQQQQNNSAAPQQQQLVTPQQPPSGRKKISPKPRSKAAAALAGPTAPKRRGAQKKRSNSSASVSYDSNDSSNASSNNANPLLAGMDAPLPDRHVRGRSATGGPMQMDHSSMHPQQLPLHNLAAIQQRTSSQPQQFNNRQQQQQQPLSYPVSDLLGMSPPASGGVSKSSDLSPTNPRQLPNSAQLVPAGQYPMDGRHLLQINNAPTQRRTDDSNNYASSSAAPIPAVPLDMLASSLSQQRQQQQQQLAAPLTSPPQSAGPRLSVSVQMNDDDKRQQLHYMTQRNSQEYLNNASSYLMSRSPAAPTKSMAEQQQQQQSAATTPNATQQHRGLTPEALAALNAIQNGSGGLAALAQQQRNANLPPQQQQAQSTQSQSTLGPPLQRPHSQLSQQQQSLLNAYHQSAMQQVAAPSLQERHVSDSSMHSHHSNHNSAPQMQTPPGQAHFNANLSSSQPLPLSSPPPPGHAGSSNALPPSSVDQERVQALLQRMMAAQWKSNNSNAVNSQHANPTAMPPPNNPTLGPQMLAALQLQQQQQARGATPSASIQRQPNQPQTPAPAANGSTKGNGQMHQLQHLLAMLQSLTNTNNQQQQQMQQRQQAADSSKQRNAAMTEAALASLMARTPQANNMLPPGTAAADGRQTPQQQQQQAANALRGVLAHLSNQRTTSDASTNDMLQQLAMISPALAGSRNTAQPQSMVNELSMQPSNAQSAAAQLTAPVVAAAIGTSPDRQQIQQHQMQIRALLGHVASMQQQQQQQVGSNANNHPITPNGHPQSGVQQFPGAANARAASPAVTQQQQQAQYQHIARLLQQQQQQNQQQQQQQQQLPPAVKLTSPPLPTQSQPQPSSSAPNSPTFTCPFPGCSERFSDWGKLQSHHTAHLEDPQQMLQAIRATAQQQQQHQAHQQHVAAARGRQQHDERVMNDSLAAAIAAARETPVSVLRAASPAASTQQGQSPTAMSPASSAQLQHRSSSNNSPSLPKAQLLASQQAVIQQQALASVMKQLQTQLPQLGNPTQQQQHLPPRAASPAKHERQQAGPITGSDNRLSVTSDGRLSITPAPALESGSGQHSAASTSPAHRSLSNGSKHPNMLGSEADHTMDNGSTMLDMSASHTFQQ